MLARMGGNLTGLARRGYLLAAVLVLVGIVVGAGGVVSAARTVADRVEGFQRVGVPGTSEVRFERAGSHTLYYEAAGVGNEEETGVTLPPVQVTLNNAQSSAPLTVKRYGGSFNYSIGGHEGFAVGTVRIERPGRYLLRADATIEPGIADIAVGRSLARGLAATLTAGLVAFGAVVAAIVIAIITAVRRRDARRTQPARV